MNVTFFFFLMIVRIVNRGRLEGVHHGSEEESLFM